MALRSQERILAVLLAAPDASQRRAMLAEALSPPEGVVHFGGADSAHGGFEEAEEDDELLFTTPLRLLQAVDAALARLGSGGGKVALGPLQALIPPGTVEGAGGVTETLRELRELLLLRIAA